MPYAQEKQEKRVAQGEANWSPVKFQSGLGHRQEERPLPSGGGESLGASEEGLEDHADV